MSAIWTSGEPVSPSLIAYSAKICFLTSASSGTWLLKNERIRFPVGDGRDEGAASPDRHVTGSVSPYHAVAGTLTEPRKAPRLRVRSYRTEAGFSAYQTCGQATLARICLSSSP